MSVIKVRRTEKPADTLWECLCAQCCVKNDESMKEENTTPQIAKGNVCNDMIMFYIGSCPTTSDLIEYSNFLIHEYSVVRFYDIIKHYLSMYRMHSFPETIISCIHQHHKNN